ncbi:hypothetical protein RAC83_000460 [Xylella fastidiosa]|nr:hypothetical protein [Xylella fastidiosa]
MTAVNVRCSHLGELEGRGSTKVMLSVTVSVVIHAHHAQHMKNAGTRCDGSGVALTLQHDDTLDIGEYSPK